MTQSISREISARSLEIVNLPVSSVFPSPLNPRKRFDPAALQELADDIKVDGVLQAITVRPRLAAVSTEPEYEIAMGERRWRASCLAGLGTIPAVIRPMDDKTLTRVALKENMQRTDLNPMETARGYQACLDTGTTEAELGKEVGLSQSRINNITRLLDLPCDVQAMIEDGKLSTGHGIQLARYKDFPALCLHLAKLAVDAQWSVKSLEAGLTHQVAGRAVQDKLIVSLGTYGIAFDWKKACAKNCPFQAFKGAPDQREDGYCLRPAHYDQLQADGLAERKKEANAEAERQRVKSEKTAEEARAAAAAATTKTERVKAEAIAVQADRTAEQAKEGLPDLTKLSYKEYEEIRSEASVPPGCSADCACRGKGTVYSGRIIECCTDPKRYKALQAAETKNKNKSAKEVLDAKLTQVRAAVRSLDERTIMSPLLAGAILHASTSVKKQMGPLLPEGGGGDKMRAMLEQPTWSVKDIDFFALFAMIPSEDQIGLALEARLRSDVDVALANSLSKTPLIDWLLSTAPPRLFDCADCQGKDMGAFYVDPNGEEVPKDLPGHARVCAGCQAKRRAEVASELMMCGQCGEPLSAGAFDEVPDRDWESPFPVRMTSGELSVSGQVYCHSCGPTRRDDGSPKLIPAEEWEYAKPPSLDKSFCLSCGVIPVSGGDAYCPNCQPKPARKEAICAL